MLPGIYIYIYIVHIYIHGERVRRFVECWQMYLGTVPMALMLSGNEENRL